MAVVKQVLQVPRYFTKGEFNPRSKDQLLAYMSTLGDSGGAATASGKASTDKKVMQALAKKNPFYKDLLDFSKIGKIKSTYADGAEAILDANDRLHAEFWHLPSTMRLCIAKGTPIEIVRDVSKFPKGVPIEDVKVGDLAYTYNKDLKLCLRKVLWAGQTGHKKVIRIHWKAGWKTERSGYLDLTPEHRVLLIDGSYKEARLLEPNDRVMALSRNTNNYGYSRLYPTGHKEVKDHRFIFQEIYGNLPEHVHHKNHNKLDNRLENLEPMTAKDHTSLHSKNPSPELQEKRRKYAKKNWPNRKEVLALGHKKYFDTHRLVLDKNWMLQVLWENQGKPTAFRDLHGIDYPTTQKFLELYNIDFKAIQNAFTSGGRRIDLRLVLEGRAIHKHVGQLEAQKHVGMNYYKWAGVQKDYGYVPYNHMVDYIEELSETVDVYDLEIEETHNFIANELTVHNSCKIYNLQNIVADKDGEGSPAAGFRHCVVAPPGSKLVEADASAVEAVFSGYFMGDPNYIRLAQLGVHDYLTSHMVGKPADLKWPDEKLGAYFKWIKATYEQERHLAKKTVHAVNFGQTPYGMVKGSPETFTLKLATELQDLYFRICPKLKEWQDTLRLLAYKNQYLGLNDHPWHYRHAFYSVFTTNAEQTKRRNGKDANRVVAFYPQSTNAGFQAEVAIRVAKRIKALWPEEPCPIRALIHDSILSEVKDEHVDEVVRIKAEEMSRPIKEMPCPPEWGMGPYLKIGVEVKVGQSWATMQKVKLQEEVGTASDTAVREWEEDDEEAA